MEQTPRIGWFGNYFFDARVVHAVRDEDIRRESYGNYGTTVCGREHSHVETGTEFATSNKDKCKRCEAKV